MTRTAASQGNATNPNHGEGGLRLGPGAAGLRQVQSIRLADAKRLVQERAAALESAEQSCSVVEDEDADSCTVASVLSLCGHCVAALEQGVTRAHLVPPVGGELLPILEGARLEPAHRCGGALLERGRVGASVIGVRGRGKGWLP